MFYYFLAPLKEFANIFNIFQYITFRAGFAAVTAFLITLLIGNRFIRWMQMKEVGEKTTKTDSDKLSELHKHKENTPTMGGLFIIASVMVAVFLWGRLDNPYVLIVCGVMVSLCLVGWLDDYMKLTMTQSKGLSIKHKLLAQLLISLAAAWCIFGIFKDTAFGTHLQLPFFKNIHPDLGWLFVVFGVLVMVSSSNAVNLTDGLDGLAIGCYVVSALAYFVVTYVVGRVDYSRYLYLFYVPESGELAVVCAALAGAGLGFLWFNCHPAQIFMGDSGALPLGGVLGCIALIVKQELLLFMVGGIFVVEGLSVALQILSFRLTGKRIFKIAPIHHHFQFIGWKENKVVVRFWILAIVLAVLSVSTLKLR